MWGDLLEGGDDGGWVFLLSEADIDSHVERWWVWWEKLGRVGGVVGGGGGGWGGGGWGGGGGGLVEVGGCGWDVCWVGVVFLGVWLCVVGAGDASMRGGEMRSGGRLTDDALSII